MRNQVEITNITLMYDRDNNFCHRITFKIKDLDQRVTEDWYKDKISKEQFLDYIDLKIDEILKRENERTAIISELNELTKSR